MTRRPADELIRELWSTLVELAEVDPGELSDLEVAESIRGAAQADSMLESFTTGVVGEADRRRLFRREGASSASTWMGAMVRRPVGECREMVRRARRLTDMPDTAGAFAQGQLAAAHVRHLIRAKHNNPEAFGRDESMLVDHATQLRFDDFVRAVDYWCQLNDPDGVEADAYDRYQARAAHLSGDVRPYRGARRHLRTRRIRHLRRGVAPHRARALGHRLGGSQSPGRRRRQRG